MTEFAKFILLLRIRVQGTPLRQSLGVWPKWEHSEKYVHFFTNYWHSSTTQVTSQFHNAVFCLIYTIDITLAKIVSNRALFFTKFLLYYSQLQHIQLTLVGSLKSCLLLLIPHKR